jgi:hypothetical protein
VILVALLACETPTPDTAEPASVFVPLDDARLARRISIDLRGHVPSVAEVERAQAGDLDRLIEEWLDDPAFEEHQADVFSEAWQLRIDTMRVAPAEFALEPTQRYQMTRAFGDEPARLVARIVADDRPWSDVVTTDSTMVNPLLDSLVQVEYLSDADADEEWREARYTDGRPAGGVLMTSGLWLRYHTTLFNYNRGRAAVMAKLLLCYDFLARPVMFAAVTDNSSDGLEEAITTNPGCIACHASLDPLAGTLFGFWPFEDKDGLELITYHPEREDYAYDYTGREPGYFGTAVDGPAQLGPMVAADPRFDMCVARRTAERMWGRLTTDADFPQVVELRDELRDGDLQYKQLLRTIIATEEYRAGSLTDAVTEEQLDDLHPLRTFTPLTFASTVEELTGHRWEWDGWDEMDSDKTGYRVLFGGADGDVVKATALEPSLSRTLVIRRLAQSAGYNVAASDLAAERSARRLIGTVTDGEAFLDPTTEEFATELRNLHLRLFAVPATEDQIADETALYTDVLNVGDTNQAWGSVVSVLLRDPDFWSY